MIEENIIEWLELGDAIQKIGIYNKRRFFFYFKQIIYLINIVIFQIIYIYFLFGYFFSKFGN